MVISSSMINATAGQSYTLVCTVFSARASRLHWVGPNGGVIDDGSNFSGWSDEIIPTELALTYSGWSNEISTLELTFHSTITSQSGVYKCVSNIAFPSSKSEDFFLVQIERKPIVFCASFMCFYVYHSSGTICVHTKRSGASHSTL